MAGRKESAAMADDRPDSMKAVNNTLTPPGEDLRTDRREYPPGPRGERVEADSGGAHAAPTYAGGPANRLDPDADPAGPARFAPPARSGEAGGPDARARGPGEQAPPGTVRDRPDGRQQMPSAADLDEAANPAMVGKV